MGTIADKLAYTMQAREEIINAIVAKGVECPSAAPFCQFDDYIAQIASGGGGGISTKAYKCILMDITSLSGGGSTIQLSEIKLYKNGVLIAWPDGTTCTASNTGFSGEDPSKLIDGNTDTKYCANFNNRCTITIETPEPIEFDSYSYVTAKDTAQYTNRCPNSWYLLGSNDGVSYSIITVVVNAEVPTTNTTETQIFSVPAGGSDIVYNCIHVMTQDAFDAADDKASLGVVGICNFGYEITKLIDASKFTEDTWQMPHTFTSNELTIDGITYTISASTVQDDNRQAYKVFDGSLNDLTGCWHSQNAAYPHLLTIQASTPIKVRQFKIVNRESISAADTTFTVKDFELQVSNDGNSWVSVGSYVNQVGSKAETVFNVDYAYTEGYQYYRLYITSNYSATDTYVTIGELYMFGW